MTAYTLPPPLDVLVICMLYAVLPFACTLITFTPAISEPGETNEQTCGYRKRTSLTIALASGSHETLHFLVRAGHAVV